MGLLASLARDFRQKRKDCGGLIIERPEQKIKINGGISCQTVKRNIAHLAIEECMIAANRLRGGLYHSRAPVGLAPDT